MLLIRSVLPSPRERDKDDDGRLNYHEYLTSLFRLIRTFDEFSSSTHEAGSSSEAQAKQLFTQLDLDHDGYVFKRLTTTKLL